MDESGPGSSGSSGRDRDSARVSGEAVPPSQAMGLNDNLSFLGRELHVQTENASFPVPHIVTQVFSGGRILLSRKSDYPADAGEASSRQRIQELMRSQHQGVIGELTEKQRKIQGER